MDSDQLQASSSFVHLREEWEALWRRSVCQTLPLSWAWFEAWWSAFAPTLGPSSELCLLTYRQGGLLRAIVPCFRHRTRFRGIPVNELRFITNGYSPLCDAVLAADITKEEIETVARSILAQPGIDVCAFHQIPSDSRLRRWYVEGTAGDATWGDKEAVRVPIVDTTVPWDTYFAKRQRKYRNKLKKKLREFDSRPNATVAYVPLRHREDAAMQEVVEVSTRSWKREAGTDLGSRPCEQSFLRRLIDHLGPTDDIGVWLAHLDGCPIAFELHVKAAGTTYPIRADFVQAASALSPGSVVEHYALRAAFEDPEVSCYDTCATNYAYLRRLTDEYRTVHQMEAFAKGLKPAALHQIEYRGIPTLRKLPALRGLKGWFDRVTRRGGRSSKAPARSKSSLSV